MSDEMRRTSLFTFPFAILIDTRNPPQVSMIKVAKGRVRIYPPFRSGPSNWLPAPPVLAHAVPFLQGRKPKHIVNDSSVLLSAAALPSLKVPGLQDAGIQLMFKSSWDTSPLIFPMDSLRIDILPEKGSVAGDINPVEIYNRVVGHLRCISRQWWITRSSDALQGSIRNEFPIDEFGKPEGDIYAAVRGVSPNGFEAPVSQSLWDKAVRATEACQEPLVEDQLLMDAHYFKAIADFRRMVLDAAAACEIVKDKTFEKVWQQTQTLPYRKGKAQHGYDLPRHLDSDLMKISGKSMAIELPLSFAVIENLWDARGNVPHGEPACYRQAGVQVKIEENNSAEILKSATECINWLRMF